jgi:U3 small nucleolar RNA-associated protein 10
VILRTRRSKFCERHCRRGSSIPTNALSFSLRHKRRIAEYLLSHVVSCGLPTVKLFLVALLEQVSDQAKAEALLPTIQSLTDKERASDLEKLFGPQFEDFATITVSALDSSVSGHLNDTSGTLWPVFLDTIRFYFQPGEYLSSHCLQPLVLLVLGSFTLPREALSKNLQSGLFSRLSLDRQTELCKSIITISAGSADAVSFHILSTTVMC